jgi:hypothetical protein
MGRNFDLTIWRAACEACSATWNLSTNSAFVLGSREINYWNYTLIVTVYVNNLKKWKLFVLHLLLFVFVVDMC